MADKASAFVGNRLTVPIAFFLQLPPAHFALAGGTQLHVHICGASVSNFHSDALICSKSFLDRSLAAVQTLPPPLRLHPLFELEKRNFTYFAGPGTDGVPVQLAFTGAIEKVCGTLRGTMPLSPRQCKAQGRWVSPDWPAAKEKQEDAQVFTETSEA